MLTLPLRLRNMNKLSCLHHRSSWKYINPLANGKHAIQLLPVYQGMLFCLKWTASTITK